MATKNKSQVNAELDKYLSKLLKEVMKDYPEGDVRQPSLTDKMKVVDRVLKWEFVKHKVNDGADWGAGFQDGE